MKNLLPRFIFILFILAIFAPAAAQEETPTNPLLEMLAFVPDTAEIMQSAPIVNFVDYRQVEAARGLEPLTALDFDARNERSGLWIASMSSVYSGPAYTNYWIVGMDEIEELVGFSLFDVDRAVTFGRLPGQGLVLAGDFDSEAIGAAHAARDYTENDVEGVTVWCSPDGCDEGLRIDVTNANPANPFGGHLGRSEPVAVLPGYIANSPDFAVLEQSIQAHTGRLPMLAANPDIIAGAQAIAATGNIRQVQAFNGVDIGLMPLEGAEALADMPPLPIYDVAFFADTWKDDTQIALVALVYDSAEDAKIAAQALTPRLLEYQSLASGQSLAELIEERGGLIGDGYVFKSADTDKSVAVLEIRYPMPPNEPVDGDFLPSGLVVRVLIQGIYLRDTGWLAYGEAAPE